ncbi:hypothetical protein FS749_004191 [Ceratobasidium sp. UAMH 11750]|nr:hypothetical protein FS749_004191 [Ceratobasidium sp. UAMH 11750]
MLALDEGETGADGMVRPVEWWYAQAIFLGLLVDRTTTWVHLKDRIQDFLSAQDNEEGARARGKLIAQRESTARRLFGYTMEVINNVISTTTYCAQPIEPANSSPVDSPLLVPTTTSPHILPDDHSDSPTCLSLKSSSGSLSPILIPSSPASPILIPSSPASPNLHPRPASSPPPASSPATADPALPPTCPPVNSSVEPPELTAAKPSTDENVIKPQNVTLHHKHNRGGRSDVHDTHGSQKNNPYADLERFLKKLVCDPDEHHFRAAVAVTQHAIDSCCPTTTPTAPMHSSSLSGTPTNMPPADSTISPAVTTPASSNSPVSDEYRQGKLYAKHCQETEKTKKQAAYAFLVAQAQFALWMCRMRQTHNKRFTDKDAHAKFVEMGLEIEHSCLVYWYRVGYNVLRLVHTSSIHIISALAVCGMQAAVAQILKDDCYNAENLLRNPYFDIAVEGE